MKTIAITNRAGGVNKTASAVAIAQAFSDLGYRTLLVDLDDQGDASNLLLSSAPDKTVASLFDGGKLPIYNVCPNLDIIPSNSNLAAVETRMEATDKSLLRDALTRVNDKYDYCLLDCAPSLGWVTINALTAADHVYVPIHADQKSVDGLARMAQACYMAATPTKIDGVFFTCFASNTRLSRGIVENVEALYGNLVFTNRIRRCVKVPEAAMNKMSIFRYAPKSTAAADYLALANEIISKIAK